MYPAIAMMGTNIMAGLCSEKRGNNLYDMRKENLSKMGTTCA